MKIRLDSKASTKIDAGKITSQVVNIFDYQFKAPGFNPFITK